MFGSPSSGDDDDVWKSEIWEVMMMFGSPSSGDDDHVWKSEIWEVMMIMMRSSRSGR